jgi:hypothetical protein
VQQELMMTETFPIIPAHTKLLWILFAIITPFLIAVIVGLFVTARGGMGATFDVSRDGLRLKGDLYGRFIPRAELRTDDARIVDLSATPELVPRWRTLGTAAGGYSAGWFKLMNGEKALLYLTDRSHAVYIPTTRGYSLLLSPQSPARFLETLRSTR